MDTSSTDVGNQWNDTYMSLYTRGFQGTIAQVTQSSRCANVRLHSSPIAGRVVAVFDGRVRRPLSPAQGRWRSLVLRPSGPCSVVRNHLSDHLPLSRRDVSPMI